jgi:hypothetical protein
MTSYQYFGKPDDGKAFLPAEEALARVLLRPLSVIKIYLQIKLSLALLFYGYDSTEKSVKKKNRWDIWHKTAVAGRERKRKLYIFLCQGEMA